LPVGSRCELALCDRTSTIELSSRQLDRDVSFTEEKRRRKKTRKKAEEKKKEEDKSKKERARVT